jgi:GT2 family glycosyltransferase
LTPGVSVVVPTRNAQETIEACVSSILENEAVDQLVIVDDSSDRTRELVSRYPVTLIQAPNKNISEKSNIGIACVSSDIIAFTDQDCVVPKDWIPQAQKLISETGADALGGPNLTFSEADFRERCSGLVLESWFGTGLSACRYRLAGFSEAIEADESKLSSCNLFLRGEALRKVGGFNPRLGSCEENELLFRMKKKGFRLFYAPYLYVWHRRRPILKPFLKGILWYGNGRGNLLRLEPRSLRAVHLVPAIFMLGLILGLVSSAMVFMPYVLVLSLYIVLDALVSVRIAIRRKTGVKSIPLLMITFFLTHLAYGVGLLYGLLGRSYRYRRERDRPVPSSQRALQ